MAVIFKKFEDQKFGTKLHFLRSNCACIFHCNSMAVHLSFCDFGGGESENLKKMIIFGKFK